MRYDQRKVAPIQLTYGRPLFRVNHDLGLLCDPDNMQGMIARVGLVSLVVPGTTELQICSKFT